MLNVDTSAVNTFLLVLLGVGGSVFLMRYIRPILDTQEKHRINLTAEVAALTTKVEAAEGKTRMLEGMVTQRAQVDDLSQRFKMASDDAAAAHRILLAEMAEGKRVAAEEHHRQLLVMNQMVVTLQGIEGRLSRDRGQRGERGYSGEQGERGEKGDHGQDVPFVKDGRTE